MKRTFKYALATVLGAAFVAPAFAQDNFPDVPENHWAYEALAKLKAAGILVGYPDGLYRGGRPLSRYELAVALNAAYQNLSNMMNGLSSQLADLKSKVDGMHQGEDLGPLKDRISALESQVAGMKGWGDDIANLKRMADTFQRELQSLGVDVEAMKRDLADLADRVKKLEANKPVVNITGDANMWIGAGNSIDHNFGLDMDGRINGMGKNGGGPSGLTKDLTMLHEVALTLQGTNDTGPKWKGTVVIGNMLNDGAFGSMSTGAGNPFFGGGSLGYSDDGAENIYINDFSVKFDTSIASLGFNAELGRVGYKVSPYIFQRMDLTSYYQNERWDNGMYYFDGGILGFNIGAGKLDIFGGETSKRQPVNPLSSTVGFDDVISSPIYDSGSIDGVLQADKTLGVNLNVPLTAAGNLNLAYLWLDTDTPVATSNGDANRLTVFGGTVNFAVGALKLQGDYSQTDLKHNDTDVNTKDNKAWQVKGGFSGDKWGIWADYREIEANFLAPGDWGRLGTLRNPTNIKGVQVGGNIDLTTALSLNAGGEFDKGKDDGFATPWDSGSKINKYNVGLGFKVNPNFTLNLGYENTEFSDLPGGGNGGNPTFAWTTLGFGYNISEKAKLTMQYQISDVKNVFAIDGGDRYHGGFFTTQLSVKF